jgi:hypothetical protein
MTIDQPRSDMRDRSSGMIIAGDIILYLLKKLNKFAMLKLKVTCCVTFSVRMVRMRKKDLLNILRSNSSVLSFKEIMLLSDDAQADHLKRRLNYYVKKGELISVRRGFYVKNKNYDRFELATKIYTPSYISFETVLAKFGIIFQHYNKIFVASYQTKEIECDGQLYSYKKIKDIVLTNTLGVENKGTYFIASKERAFLDTLYLNREYHFDNLLPLDFDIIQSMLPIYKNKRMVNSVARYFENLKLNEVDL